MTRNNTLSVCLSLHNLIRDKSNYRFDKATNQNFIEIQNCNFIADSPYIVKHDKTIYDEKWYEDNYDVRIMPEQYRYCLEQLANDKYSRRAIIYMGDSINNDICTISMQMLLENDKLNWIVNMRSNSVIKYTTDYKWQMKWFTKFTENLSLRTNTELKKGTLYWNAGSMHLYEEDFKYLKL